MGLDELKCFMDDGWQPVTRKVFDLVDGRELENVFVLETFASKLAPWCGQDD